MSLAAYEVSLLNDHPVVVPQSDWMLIREWWPICVVLSCYLYFVLKAGIRFMENKKPYKLNTVILVYNIFTVIFNLYMIIMTTMVFIKYPIKNVICRKSENVAQANSIQHAADSVAGYFAMSKILELLDTVFFVLRKKYSQISGLHVYHHTNMAFFTRLFYKYSGSTAQALPIGYANCFIHVLMYTYYAISAAGVDVGRKHVAWKKILTKLQLAQFILIIIYLFGLSICDCEFPRGLAPAMTFNVLTFLILFLNFYKRAYFNLKSSTAPAATAAAVIKITGSPPVESPSPNQSLLLSSQKSKEI